MPHPHHILRRPSHRPQARHRRSIEMYASLSLLFIFVFIYFGWGESLFNKSTGEGDKEGCFGLKPSLITPKFFWEGEGCPKIIRNYPLAGGKGSRGKELSRKFFFIQTPDRGSKSGRKVIKEGYPAAKRALECKTLQVRILLCIVSIQ